MQKLTDLGVLGLTKISAQYKKESMRSCLELRIIHNQNICQVKNDPDLKKEEKSEQ